MRKERRPKPLLKTTALSTIISQKCSQISVCYIYLRMTHVFCTEHNPRKEIVLIGVFVRMKTKGSTNFSVLGK